MTISHYYYYYYSDEWPESNPNKESNWREITKEQPRQGQQVGKRRERSDAFLQRVPNHIIQEHTQKEKGVLSCRTLVDNVHMPYPWIPNSSSRKRRGRCNVIIIIRMVPIGQYIIHRTRHTLASSLTNIPIHYYRFVVHTNIVIYNNQQQ